MGFPFAEIWGIGSKLCLCLWWGDAPKNPYKIGCLGQRKKQFESIPYPAY